MSVTGLKGVLDGIDKASKRYRDAARAAIYQKGLQIDGDAARMTPVNVGILRASHYVAPPTRGGIVEVGFGTDYAVPVHERTEVSHPVGEAKFLEKAVNKHRGSFEKDVAALTRSNFDKGVQFGVSSSVPTRPKE